MRSNLARVFGTAVVIVGVAACGSSSSSSTTSSAPPSTTHGTSRARARAGLPSRTYRLKLTGKAVTPPGAPKGAGLAVIALHGRTRQVCWRFARLRGFTNATVASIHRGVAATSGNIVVPLSTGPKLHHKGCVPASAALIRAIEKDPHAYYVTIHSKQYPSGAVRAQL